MAAVVCVLAAAGCGRLTGDGDGGDALSDASADRLGDVHPVTGPFPIDRSDGVTITLADATIAFVRPGDVPLDPAFTAGPVDVTDSLAVGIEDGGVRLTLAAVAAGDGDLALLAGPGGSAQVRPAADPAPIPPAAGGLDRTLHRQSAPVTGEFHALGYEIDGETRATADDAPFRIVVTDDGASWYADWNEVNAGGRWDSGRLVVAEAYSTAVGCRDMAQSAELALWDGFELAQRDGRWTLTEGSLTIPLTAGPPVDPDTTIPAGRWVGAGIGWSPFNFSGEGSTVRLTMGDGGTATLDTGCRQIPLDLSPGAPALAGVDLPPSTGAR